MQAVQTPDVGAPMTAAGPRESGLDGPIVIGGLGGSGTRVVAKLALALGIHLGNDLDQRLDDRWFNLLFFRPEWLRRRFDAGSNDIRVGLDVMRSRALGMLALHPREIAFIARAWRDVSRRPELSRHPSVWGAGRIWSFVRSKRYSSTAIGWGWKEPISHLIAPDLLSHCPDARYIHVMRHGLDMVRSANKKQQGKFSTLFGISRPPKGRRFTAQERLQFWVRANRRIVDGIGKTHAERVHLLRFDDLCAAPEREIARLIQFLGIDVAPDQLLRLSELVIPPASIGQYRSDDLTRYERADLNALANLGFSVPAHSVGGPTHHAAVAIPITAPTPAGRGEG
jgi:hypothetical protein